MLSASEGLDLDENTVKMTSGTFRATANTSEILPVVGVADL